MKGTKNDAILRAGALGTMVNASTYGRTIPLIFGTTRTSLLAIWASNLRKGSTSKKRSAPKGTPTYTEAIDFLLAHNPSVAPLQAWDNANTFYPLGIEKNTQTLSGTTTFTYPGGNVYAVLGVTVTVPYSVTFNDYGGTGPSTLTGNFEVPMWNALFNGPDPVDTWAYTKYWPYVYKWMPGDGSVITIPYLANLGTFTVTVYAAFGLGHAAAYAYSKSNTGSKHTITIPVSALNLSQEAALGQGPSGQPIVYPWFCGLGSSNIDLGASGAIPNINIEMQGSYIVHPDATLTTLGGDADFADMIEAIFKSGPIQGAFDSSTSTAGAVGSTAVQYGLNCNDFPGLVQRRMWQSPNFESLPTSIPFEAQVTKGDFLVVFYRDDTVGTPPSGISDTMGNSWTPLLAANPTSNVFCYGWYAIANSTGPTAITVSTAGSDHQELDMYEFAGFDTIESIVTTSSGVAGTPSMSITSSTLRTRPGLLFAWWNFLQPGYPQTAAPRWTAVTGISVNPNNPTLGVVAEVRKVWAPTTVVNAHAAEVGFGWAGCAFALKSAKPPQYPISLGNILDETTLANANAGARAAGLWGSITMGDSRKASDILKDLYASMNAAPVWSGFKLKSIALSEVSIVGNGSIFTAPTASGPVATLTDNDYVGDADNPPMNPTRKAETDAPPILSMQHFDRLNNYDQTVTSVPEAAGVALFGVRKAQPMKRDEIQDPGIARKLLAIATRNQVYMRNQYKAKVQARRGILLEPMDLVLISSAQLGISSLPVRVLQVEEDAERNLTITFIPFIYGLNNPQNLTVTGNTPFRPIYGSDPGSVNTPIFIEEVPLLALAENTNQLMLVISAGSPNYGGCAVYISTDGGASYQTQQDWIINGSAITGVTTADFPIGTDPDSADMLKVDLTESLGALSDFTAAQRDAFNSICYLAGGTTNIPYELVAYAMATLTATNKYTIDGTAGGNAIRRCVYGAPANATGVDHPNGSRFAFIGNPAQGIVPGILTIPIQPAWIGVTLSFKFQAFNILQSNAQELSACTPYTFTPTGLAGSVNPGGVPPQLVVLGP